MKCCLCGQPLEPGDQVDDVDGDEAHTECALEHDDDPVFEFPDPEDG